MPLAALEDGAPRQGEEGVTPALQAPELAMLRTEVSVELILRFHAFAQEDAKHEVVHVDRTIGLRVVVSIAIFPGDRSFLDRDREAVELAG